MWIQPSKLRSRGKSLATWVFLRGWFGGICGVWNVSSVSYGNNYYWNSCGSGSSTWYSSWL